MAVNVCERRTRRGEWKGRSDRPGSLSGKVPVARVTLELLRDVDSVGRGLLMAMALYMMVNTRFLSALREELGDGDPQPSPFS